MSKTRWLSGPFLVLIVMAHAGAQQRLPVSIDCGASRLGRSEREICAAPPLMQLNGDAERLTRRLEGVLTGKDREALIDTERPFVVQRNACGNERAVRDCVERVLRHRVDALTATASVPSSIRGEVAQYKFLDIGFLRKYGEQLAGNRVSVFGCMELDKGSTPEARASGTIRTACGDTTGPRVVALFKSMNADAARFFDTKMPSSYWEGIVARRANDVALTQIEPGQ